MSKLLLTLFLLPSLVTAHDKCSTDEAIRRVENCTCYLSAEGQQLEPWQLSWEDSKKLKSQFSHCICVTHIDIKQVNNPKRYIVPNTIVK